MSFLWHLPSLSFTASVCVVVVVLCASLVIKVENKSFFGIGARVVGDQLLLKDVLQSPPSSLTEEPVIRFLYAIEESITYLEIESDKSVQAKVKFSYEQNLVEGNISCTQNKQQPGAVKQEAFEVLVRIYGFNETAIKVNPAHILNKGPDFDGILKPMHYQQKINHSLSLTQEDLNGVDDLLYDDYEDDDTGDEEDFDYEEDDFNSNYDKIIEQGQRQEGDFLVYESNQTSATTTELPTNHSVTFYYIDIYYITYVKFIIYEHYLYHPLNGYDNTYVVEYAHISPTTLKAIVTDHRTTSLFVQMQMYGFRPTALPVDYKTFLSNGQTSATTSPISSLKQLKILMNAQQQQSDTNKDLQLQSQELDSKIFPDNGNNVNCMQQVLATVPQTANNSQRIFAHYSIFNMIVAMFVILGIFFI